MGSVGAGINSERLTVNKKSALATERFTVYRKERQKVSHTHLAAMSVLWLSCLSGGGALAQEMITIPAGPFTMGRDDGPEDERPAHQVHLPAFQIVLHLARQASAHRSRVGKSRARHGCTHVSVGQRSTRSHACTIRRAL